MIKKENTSSKKICLKKSYTQNSYLFFFGLAEKVVEFEGSFYITSRWYNWNSPQKALKRKNWDYPAHSTFNII